jgi:putative ABC transport system permease protein
MIKQFISTYFRSIRRSQFQFFAIVAGLSLGIAVSLLIFVYVREERSFDNFHEDAASIYRVNTTLEMEGKTDHTAKAGLNTGESLANFYPEVRDHTQVLNVAKQTIRIEDNFFATERVVYADSNFFTFFSFPFVAGSAIDALNGPNKAVISLSAATLYFGSAEKAFQQNFEVNKKEFLVAGVYDDQVGRSHFPYNVFLSLSTLSKDFLSVRNREYMWLTTYNYIKLAEDVKGEEFQRKLASFNEKELVPYVKKSQVNGSITFNLEPLTHIHLNNKLRFDYKGAVNPEYLVVFSVVGILTLLIAIINYINLTTAKVSNRIKEVGIKKYLGASRFTLFVQFVFETFITSLVSLCIALVLVYAVLPQMGALTDSDYPLAQVIDKNFFATALSLVVVFALFGSAYPAVLLSSFRPLSALKKYSNVSTDSSLEKIISPSAVRKILVTVQFSVSIFLIVGTIIIFQQFSFMSKQNLGFDQEQVLVIDVPNDTAVSNHIDVVRNLLLQIPGVKQASTTAAIPGSDHGALTMNVSQSGGSEIKVINTYMVDDRFTETLGLEIKEGRFFSREYSTDPQESFVINEAAAKFLGWDSPLQKKVESPLGQKGVVVGVVKDFNYKSLHSSIEPLIMMNSPTSQGYLLIKIVTSNVRETVEKISAVWTNFDRGHPYEYFFLDDQFQQQYIKEQKLMTVFLFFSGFAIFISCLGLIGLSIFTNETRVKEVGIRKTLGATKTDIVGLLSRGFLVPIIAATIIAWAAGYALVRDWLTSFAYRVELTAVPFIGGALIAFLIAAGTVAYFSYLAARKDIVSSLRYE